MDRNQSVPVHRMLLKDPARLVAAYDQAAAELIAAVRPEGYFEGWATEDLTWPEGAAAEIGLAFAIILRMYRNSATVNVDEINLMKW